MLCHSGLCIYVCTCISDWLSGSEPWWTAHTQDETELSGRGPVLQRCSGTVGEKTNSPRQNNCSARQEGVIPCTLPRWMVCVWVCVHSFACLYECLLSFFFMRRCSQEQTWGGLVASFLSASAPPQAAPASACPRHTLSWSAEAADRAATCHSGGSRCEGLWNQKKPR